MTNERAIEILERRTTIPDDDTSWGEIMEAIDLAIEALKMDEDAKQASIPYTYNAPQHDWKCGYSTTKHSWVYNKIKEADNDRQRARN